MPELLGPFVRFKTRTIENRSCPFGIYFINRIIVAVGKRFSRSTPYLDRTARLH